MPNVSQLSVLLFVIVPFVSHYSFPLSSVSFFLLIFIILFYFLISRNFAENVEPASWSALPMDTGVSASQDLVSIREGAPVPAMMLHSEVLDGNVEDATWKYTACFDLRRLNALFFDGRNVIMYDRRGVNRETYLAG